MVAVSGGVVFRTDGAGVAEHASLGTVAVLRLGDQRAAKRVLADRGEPADSVEDGIVVVGDVVTALYSYAGLNIPLEFSSGFCYFSVAVVSRNS